MFSSTAFKKSKRPNRPGLTIVELLVVLGIIGVLIGLLLPAVHVARERARETVCKNNLHQLNLATVHFSEVHKKLPNRSEPGQVGGWMVEILPFIEQQNLKLEVILGAPIISASPKIFRPPAVFRCPRRTVFDDTPDNQIFPGHYVFVPLSGRRSFMLFDAPVGLNVPWLNGPEMAYETISKSKGPHSDGFFFTRGSQHGVSFMLGQEVQ